MAWPFPRKILGILHMKCFNLVCIHRFLPPFTSSVIEFAVMQIKCSIIIRSDRRSERNRKESDTFRSQISNNVKYSMQTCHFRSLQGRLFCCCMDYLPVLNSVVVPHRLNHAHSDRNLMPSVVKMCSISPKNRTTAVPHAD